MLLQANPVAWRTLAQYQAALSSSVFPIDIELSGSAQDFRAGLAARRLGYLSLVKAVANHPFVCRRRSDGIGLDDGHLLLMLQEAGTNAYQHGGRTALCEPGSLVLLDARRAIVGQQFEPAEALVVRIPVRRLTGLLPRVEDYCATAVSARNGSAAILAGMVRECWDANRELTEHDRSVLPESMLRLVEAVFHPVAGAPDTEVADKASRFERLRAAVREHADDPDLSCDRLCELLSMSRTSVYGLTRMAGTSLERMIVDERLARTAACLRDPAWAGSSVTDIAFAKGFRDLSHFSRRFKERFGVSPTQFRAQGAPPL